MSRSQQKATKVKTKAIVVPSRIVFLVVLLVIGTGVAAVVDILLGPPSAPRPQAIGAVEVNIGGVNTNPKYGELFDWDLWEVSIISNTYTMTLAMRPLIKITNLLDCSTIELQVSSDGASYSSVSVVSVSGVCEGDPTALLDKSVSAGVTGTKWFFSHRFTTNFNQYGDTLQFIAQTIQ